MAGACLVSFFVQKSVYAIKNKSMKPESATSLSGFHALISFSGLSKFNVPTFD